jgi:acetate kinase
MESPNSFTEEEQAHTLEEVFQILVRSQNGRAMAHDPGKSTGDMEKDANEGVVSTDTSRVVARVIRTDEELMIARTICRVLGLG